MEERITSRKNPLLQMVKKLLSSRKDREAAGLYVSDGTKLLEEAAAYKVAFVAGEGFFTDGGGRGRNCMRMSFGSLTPDKIRIGMERLGKLIASKTEH